MKNESKNWYVIYTKPRWEKKVDRILRERGLISYCPLNKVTKKWSDRYKIVEEPLFKSYGFVYLALDDLQKVRMVDGVLNFIYWNGKPAIVKDKEIEEIKMFMNEYDEVDVVPFEIKPRTRVRIKRGIMMNKEAEVLQVKSRIVEVIIESIGYKLVAKIDKNNLVPIR